MVEVMTANPSDEPAAAVPVADTAEGTVGGAVAVPGGVTVVEEVVLEAVTIRMTGAFGAAAAAAAAGLMIAVVEEVVLEAVTIRMPGAFL